MVDQDVRSTISDIGEELGLSFLSDYILSLKRVRRRSDIYQLSGKARIAAGLNRKRVKYPVMEFFRELEISGLGRISLGKFEWSDAYLGQRSSCPCYKGEILSKLDESISILKQIRRNLS